MHKKTTRVSAVVPEALDLKAAVEQFVAQGGVIDLIPIGESCTSVSTPTLVASRTSDAQDDNTEKVELLRELVAKGAGFSSLQLSLKMNRKDIKQLAVDHGIKIPVSKPLGHPRRACRYDPTDVDDTVAGHAMHYSSLGYSVPEIAEILGLTLRQVWNIGKAYRFEFKQNEDD